MDSGDCRPVIAREDWEIIAFDCRWWFEAWGYIRDGEWRRGELRIGITYIVIAQRENETALLIPLSVFPCVSGSVLNALQLHNILWPLKPATSPLGLLSLDQKNLNLNTCLFSCSEEICFLFISKAWEISVLCLFRKIWFEFRYQKLES